MIAAELAQDAAVQAADTVLLTVPNQLGVDYNAHLLRHDRRPHRARDRLERQGIALAVSADHATIAA